MKKIILEVTISFFTIVLNKICIKRFFTLSIEENKEILSDFISRKFILFYIFESNISAMRWYLNRCIPVC